MLVDSHCHLDYPDFAEELPAVLKRAKAAGVGHMVTICTRLSKFDGVKAVAEAHDNIYCSVGIHPHDAGKEPRTTVRELVELTNHPKVVGIGETGLDFYYDNSPRDDQEASFRIHIGASRETGLPTRSRPEGRWRSLARRFVAAARAYRSGDATGPTTPRAASIPPIAM